VGTWTVDDPERIRTLFSWGVDAVASNDPVLALTIRAQFARA
jgi:glycerophosphoryl diester phosphodiesterase